MNIAERIFELCLNTIDTLYLPAFLSVGVGGHRLVVITLISSHVFIQYNILYISYNDSRDKLYILHAMVQYRMLEYCLELVYITR